MKNLVICGDSFSIGIGCRNLKTEPYGSLLSEKLKFNLINFGKGSSTNFSIYLQVKYAVENIKDIGLLIVAPTCHYRTEFFSKEVQFGNELVPTKFDNCSVNYHQYPPYGKNTYIDGQELENPMGSNPRYKPILFTENFHGIFDYLNVVENKVETNYYERYKNEDISRFISLRNNCVDNHHGVIQRLYDFGMINLAHSLLIKNQIPHLIFDNFNEMIDIIPDYYRTNVNWGELSSKYPDDIPTSHTSAEGHKEVYKMVLEKLENRNESRHLL